MAWRDPFETVNAQSGELYVAAVGTAFPTGGATPGASWTGLGYISEDGAAFNSSRTIEEFRAWQSQQPIRRSKTEETFSIAAALLQWNESTLPAALGGGAVTSGESGYIYTPPAAADNIEEFAVMLEVQDGTRTMRIRIPRATAGSDVEATFDRGSLAELPISFDALQPTTGTLFTIWFSDTDAFAAGS